VFNCFKKFKAVVEKQSDRCIKVLRTMVVVSTPKMNLTNSVKMKEYYIRSYHTNSWVKQLQLHSTSVKHLKVFGSDMCLNITEEN
jgi:hypothetical protein